MSRTIATMTALGLALCLSTAALAQAQVPVTQDLRRLHQYDGPPDQDVSATGAIRPRRGAEPFGGWHDPSGIPGFNGPPGTYGDSVGSYSPLPPGAPGNEVEW